MDSAQWPGDGSWVFFPLPSSGFKVCVWRLEVERIGRVKNKKVKKKNKVKINSQLGEVWTWELYTSIIRSKSHRQKHCCILMEERRSFGFLEHYYHLHFGEWTAEWLVILSLLCWLFPIIKATTIQGHAYMLCNFWIKLRLTTPI